MDELQKRGGKLIYDPRFLVFRRPRTTLKSFARMLMTYGRGRAEQFRVQPSPGSILNLVPPLFVLFLAALPVLLSFPVLRIPCYGLLALYAVLVLGQGVLLARGGKVLASLAATPLVVLTHVLYGAGFWRGLFTEIKPPEKRAPVPVELEKVT